MRDPVLVGLGPGKVRTVVLRWATDDQGYIDVPAIRGGGVQVLAWDLGERALQALRERHASWPLDCHDLLVSGSLFHLDLFPCHETLRTADLGLDLERRIEVMTRTLWNGRS